VAGVILTILGVLGAIYGTQTYLKDAPKTITDTFQIGSNVKERDIWSYSLRFDTSTLVIGNGTTSSVAFGKPNEIDFLVLDSVNFDGWKKRQLGVQYIVEIVEAPTAFDFHFTTPKNDTYYFVFDNYRSTVQRDVSLVVRYQYVKIVKEPHVDYTIAYAGSGLAVCGTIVLAYGLLKKPEIRWA
jgi:hypothetical protein